MYPEKKALQACIIPRNEISIQYKCKEYLTDIQRLICANMNYEIICRLYQGKIKYIFRTFFLTCTIYRTLIQFQPFTLMKVLFYINQGK